MIGFILLNISVLFKYRKDNDRVGNTWQAFHLPIWDFTCGQILNTLYTFWQLLAKPSLNIRALIILLA